MSACHFSIFTIFAVNKRRNNMWWIGIITGCVFGIIAAVVLPKKSKKKKSKYNWSLKAFFNDSRGDVVHFPSKKHRC